MFLLNYPDILISYSLLKTLISNFCSYYSMTFLLAVIDEFHIAQLNTELQVLFLTESSEAFACSSPWNCFHLFFKCLLSNTFRLTEAAKIVQRVPYTQLPLIIAPLITIVQLCSKLLKAIPAFLKLLLRLVSVIQSN